MDWKKILGALTYAIPGVGPVVGTIASIAGPVIAGAIGSHASHEAANQQIAAQDRALALQKQQFDASQARTQPYVNVGTQALNTLNGQIGNSPRLPQNGPAPSGPMMNPYAGMSPAMASGGQMVTLRAPDGTTKAVPANQADAWMRKGAVRVM